MHNCHSQVSALAADLDNQAVAVIKEATDAGRVIREEFNNVKCGHRGSSGFNASQVDELFFILLDWCPSVTGWCCRQLH